MGRTLEKKQTVIAVTPVINNQIYADKDQMGAGGLELAYALDDVGGTCTIRSVTVIDKAIQSAAIDLLFFNSSPTVTSANNDALAITDAEMVSKFLGRVSIPAASYVAQAGASDCTVCNIGLICKGVAGSRSLYVIPVSRGTPTYSAASDLVIKIGIDQD